MDEEIRKVLAKHGRLPVAVDSLSDDDDLYAAGLTSHASVNLMLGARGRVRSGVPGRDAAQEYVRLGARHPGSSGARRSGARRLRIDAAPR